MSRALTAVELDQIVENQCFHLPYFRAMLRSVEQSFYPVEGLAEPVLDIGSGDGHFAWAMLADQKYFGFDPWLEPSVEALKYDAYHLITLSDAHSLPVGDGMFASALSNSVLEHIPMCKACSTKPIALCKRVVCFISLCPIIAGVKSFGGKPFSIDWG